MPGVVAVFTGADLRRVGGAPAVRLAGHRGHQDHRALAARERQGAATRATASRWWSPTARAAAGRGRAGRGRLRAAARGRRRRRRRWRTARRWSTTSSARTSPASGGSRRATFDRRSRTPVVKVSSATASRRLIPNAMEPRGVRRAPWPGGESRCGPRPRSRTSCGCSPRRRSGSPRRSCAWSRPTSAAASARSSTSTPRRRSPRARAAARPAGQVDRGARGGLRRHDPRPRRLHDIELAATEDGEDQACGRTCIASMGAYLQLVTPGIPMLGAWLYAGLYDVEGYSFAFTGVFTNTTPTDAYRGAGRPEATYAVERTMDAARARARDGPGRAAPAELHHASSRPTIASGLDVDSGDYHAHSTRLLERARLRRAAAEQQARRDAGDTKQLGIGFSTYVEMCGLAPSRILGAIRYAAGGWEAATIRCLPTGTVQVVDGHVAARAGPRHGVLADRGRPARRATSDVEVLHGDTSDRAARAGHLREPPPGGGRRRALRRRAKGHREGARDRRAPAGGPATTTSTTRAARSRSRAARQGDDDQGAACAAWAAHDLPDGMEPGLEATDVYDPPNFSWPGGAHAASSRSTPRRARAARALRRGRRRRHGHQPADRRRARCTAASRRASRGALRGGALRRGRQPAERHDGDVPRAVGGRAAAYELDRTESKPDRPSARGEGRGGDRARSRRPPR